MAYGISNEGIVDMQTRKSKFNIEKVWFGNIFFDVGDGELRDRYTKLAAKHSETVRFKHYIPSIIDSLATFEIEKLNEEGKREVEQVGMDEIESQQREAQAILSMVREHFASILEGLEPNTVDNRNGRLFSSDGKVIYYSVTLELYGEGFLHNHKQGDTLVAVVASGFNFKSVKTEEGFTKKFCPLRLHEAEERKEPYADYEIHRILMTAILTGKPVEEIITQPDVYLSGAAAVDMSYGNMSIKTMPLRNTEIEGGIARVVRDYEEFAEHIVSLLNPANEKVIKEAYNTAALYKLIMNPDSLHLLNKMPTVPKCCIGYLEETIQKARALREKFSDVEFFSCNKPYQLN